VESARLGLELARSAEVPEPPPLYWEVFRRQVGRRIGEEAPARRAIGFWLFPALATATAVLIAFGLLRGPVGESSREPAAAPLPAWSALPPADQDEGLEVLQALAAEGGPLDAALPPQGVADVLQDEMTGADTL
jgi:hypothetical protein